MEQERGPQTLTEDVRTILRRLSVRRNSHTNVYEFRPDVYAYNVNQYYRLRQSHRSLNNDAFRDRFIGFMRSRGLASQVSEDENLGIGSSETQQSFENLERFKIEEGAPEAESKCCICLEELSIGSRAIRLPNPCSHVFHQDCIIRWLNMSNTCPICRRPI